MENNSYGSYDGYNKILTYNFQYHDNLYTNHIKSSVLHNWAFVFSDKHKIEFKNLLNQIGFNRTTLRDGYDNGYTSNIT